jgi:hypothetical protein
MKSSKLRLATLLAVASISGLAAAAPALRTAGIGNNRRPTPPRMDTALAREIAEHNAEVDRRKAEKRLAKDARRKAAA